MLPILSELRRSLSNITLEILEDGAFNGEYLRDIYFTKDIPRVGSWVFRNFFKETANIHAPADSKIAELSVAVFLFAEVIVVVQLQTKKHKPNAERILTLFLI